jgi:hypothetical protein
MVGNPETDPLPTQELYLRGVGLAPNSLPGSPVAVFSARDGTHLARLGRCWRVKNFSGIEGFWALKGPSRWPSSRTIALMTR